MREETKARLEALMARYERRLAEMRRKQELIRIRHDTFIAEFERVIEETIRPVMEDIGAALRERGHDYQIATTQGYSDFEGRLHNIQITMRIFPAGIDRSLFTSTSTPYVAFVSDRHGRRITVQESTMVPMGVVRALPAGGGKSGQKAAYAMQQLTPPVIEREIIEVLAGIFGK